MKTLKSWLITSVLAITSLFSGCTNVFSGLDSQLNGISAKEVTYSRKFYGSTAVVKAENYVNNNEYASADTIFIDETVPVVGNVTLELKGYKRNKNGSTITEETKKEETEMTPADTEEKE